MNSAFAEGMNMRVAAFRIRNFRSIVDTGWVNLSRDGITALVGQNEAGKTSVLEAIFAFENPQITQDDQRSDDSVPEVGLSFELHALPTKLMPYELPADLDKQVKARGMRINLLRTWDAELNSNNPMLDPEQGLSDLFPEEVSEKQGEIYTDPLSARQFAGELWNHTPVFTLFSENDSLLPSHIDLGDLRGGSTSVEGMQAVKNFIAVTGLRVEDLGTPKKQRPEERRLREASKLITDDFQSFWEQTVGRQSKVSFECVLKHHDQDSDKPGQPYLEFLVNDNRERLHLKQRSKGLQWFLSFYLQMQASAKENSDSASLTLFLIDEPGGSLHAKAQGNVLRVLEDLRKDIQVVYTTHSPFLINIEELGRLLVAERSDDEDESSPTIVRDVHRFSGDNEAALFPIYAAIGADLSHQRLASRTDNVLLEEMSAYHYLRAFLSLVNEKATVNLIPGSGATTTAPLFANLFTGWGLQFIVFVDNDREGIRITRKIRSHLYVGRDDDAKNDLKTLPVGTTIEDVLTPDDFKRWVLQDPAVEYDVSNGEYVKASKKSKGLLAAEFSQLVANGDITASQLSRDSMENIQVVVKTITAALKSRKSRRD
jgi:hypothetical protein